MDNTIVSQFSSEFDAEIPATRKCIERIPESLYDWKPHEKSMTLGYLVLLVAEIPAWITEIITVGEINLSTRQHFQPRNSSELVQHFENNVTGTEQALEQVTNEALTKSEFHLRNNEGV